MKLPYLILHKQSRILNTPNSVARVFDDIGSKCKMMYHFKISAEAGIQLNKTVLGSRLRGSDGFSDFLRDHQAKNKNKEI
jgi:hypothetical protein